MQTARAHLDDAGAAPTGAPLAASRIDATPELFSGEGYGALFAASDATAFQHPVWMSAFARHVAPGRDARMHLVTLRDAAGAWHAAFAAVTRSFSGAVLLEAADLGVSDYCAPVLHRDIGGDPARMRDAARLIASALPRHDILRLRNIRPEHAPFFEALAGAAARPAGFSAHAVPLGPDKARWTADALTPSFAKYLARRVRKVEALPGADLRAITDPQAAAEAIATLARLREGRFDGDMIARPEVEAFYADVARRGTATGFASVHALTVDGRPAGLTFGIRHGGRHHYLLIGCDYAAFGNLSPGLVLYDFGIGDWIAAGGAEFDFTIGDEPFKMDFGTRPTPIAMIERGVSLVGRAALLARELRRRMTSGKEAT